jgi:hypothetical protein
MATPDRGPAPASRRAENLLDKPQKNANHPSPPARIRYSYWHSEPTKINPMKQTIVLAALLALALPLHAEEEGAAGQGKKKPDPAKVFKKKDSNADGFLSKEEFVAGSKDAAKAEAAFAKKDKDGDGKLSAEEFAAGPAAGGKKKKHAEE